MKSFALDENGDLLIENERIQMVHGNDLTMQKLKTVYGTQKGEWFLNWEQGINRNEILGKNRPEDDVVKAELLDGATQVDSNFTVDEVETEYDRQARKLTIHCVAVNSENGETVEIDETL